MAIVVQKITDPTTVPFCTGIQDTSYTEATNPARSIYKFYFDENIYIMECFVDEPINAWKVDSFDELTEVNEFCMKVLKGTYDE